MQDFFGNSAAAGALAGLVERGRIPQTLLLAGPEGVGKATLARRFGAMLLGDARKIEKDDLSLLENQARIADREKWTAEKRNDDPLVFASHPDFLTFAPDGPLRQITISQMRLLKDRAALKPLKGSWRMFLVDGIDRANEQAANSLLKILEEPPPHLVVVLTARNLYDLLPTIRSRSVIFQLSRLDDREMRAFLNARSFDEIERRSRLAEGSPGTAAALDLEEYERRRSGLLALLRVGAQIDPFPAWLKHAESVGARRSEKLESYLDVLYVLLSDILRLLHSSGPIRNEDFRNDLEALARRVSFEWVRNAVTKADELVELARRNIQKSIALDALAMNLQQIPLGLDANPVLSRDK